VELVTECAATDAFLFKRATRVAALPLAELMATTTPVCPPPYLEPAVHQLASLDDFTTPAEKLACIQDTVALLARAAERHARHLAATAAAINAVTDDRPDGVHRPSHARTHSDVEPSPPLRPLSNDELLPMFIYVLARAKLMHLHTNLVYIRTFHLRGTSGNLMSSESRYDNEASARAFGSRGPFTYFPLHCNHVRMHSFHLTTFEASVEYLRHYRSPSRKRTKTAGSSASAAPAPEAGTTSEAAEAPSVAASANDSPAPSATPTSPRGVLTPQRPSTPAAGQTATEDTPAVRTC